jgi:CHAT domain-containing protein/tetratricopeptide (TPR) repeat protein
MMPDAPTNLDSALSTLFPHIAIDFVTPKHLESTGVRARLSREGIHTIINSLHCFTAPGTESTLSRYSELSSTPLDAWKHKAVSWFVGVLIREVLNLLEDITCHLDASITHEQEWQSRAIGMFLRLLRNYCTRTYPITTDHFTLAALSARNETILLIVDDENWEELINKDNAKLLAHRAIDTVERTLNLVSHDETQMESILVAVGEAIVAVSCAAALQQNDEARPCDDRSADTLDSLAVTRDRQRFILAELYGYCDDDLDSARKRLSLYAAASNSLPDPSECALCFARMAGLSLILEPTELGDCKAIAYCLHALEFWDPDDSPDNWAKTHDDIAAIYATAHWGDLVENRRLAAAHYQECLKIWTYDESPWDWAMVHRDLQLLYSTEHALEIQGHAALAVEHGMQALRVLSPDISAACLDLVALRISSPELYGLFENEEWHECIAEALDILIEARLRANKNEDPMRWAQVQALLALAALSKNRGYDEREVYSQLVECRSIWAMGPQTSTPALTGPYSRITDPTSEHYNVREAIADVLHDPGDMGQSIDWRRRKNGISARLLRDNVRPPVIFSNGVQRTTMIGGGREHREVCYSVVTNVLADVFLRRFDGDRSENIKSAVLLWDECLPVLERYSGILSLDGWFRLGEIHLEQGAPEQALASWSHALAYRRQAFLKAAGRIDRKLVMEATGSVVAKLTRLHLDRHALLDAVRTIEVGRAMRFNELLAADAQITDIEFQSLAELSELVPEGGALIWFVTGGRKGREGTPGRELVEGAAIVVTVTQIELVRLPLLEAFSAMELRMHWHHHHEMQTKRMRNGTKEVWRDLDTQLRPWLTRLWDIMMGPVIDALESLRITPGSEIVLMPEGYLANLPLHVAMREKNGGWRCVLDDYVVSYCPSGFARRIAIQRLKAGRKLGIFDTYDRGSGLLGVFNPRNSTDYDLREAETVEMPALRKIFVNDRSRIELLVGSDASVDRLIGESQYFGYLHFATHAQFNDVYPEESALRLANNQDLTYRQILEELKLVRCRCVSLSACQTSVVDDHDLIDEFRGLAPAFMRAGSPGVAGTLWAAASGPAALVMKRFYELHLHPERPMAPAAALRSAVLQLRDGEMGADDIELGARAYLGDFPPKDNGAAEDVGPLEAPADYSPYSLAVIWGCYAYWGA